MGVMTVPAVIGAIVMLALIIMTHIMSALFDHAEAKEKADRASTEPMLPMDGLADMAQITDRANVMVRRETVDAH